MRDHPAHFHHQGAGRHEQRRPAGVGGGRHEDFPGLEVRAHRIQDDPDRSGGGAGRRRCPGEGAGSGGLGHHGRLHIRAVGEQEPGNPAPAQFDVVDPVAARDDALEVGTPQTHTDLVEFQEIHVVRGGDRTGPGQLDADRVELAVHFREGEDDVELGQFAQSGQLAGPVQAEFHQPGTDPAAAPGPFHQAADPGLGMFLGAGELPVGRLLGVGHMQVVRDHPEDVVRLLRPPRHAKVDLRHGAVAVAVQEPVQAGLCHCGQRAGLVQGGQFPWPVGQEHLPGRGIRADGDGQLPELEVHLGGDIVGQTPQHGLEFPRCRDAAQQPARPGQHEVSNRRSGQRRQDQPVHGVLQDALGVIEPAKSGGRFRQDKFGLKAISVIEGAAQFGGRPHRGPHQGRKQPDRQAQAGHGSGIAPCAIACCAAAGPRPPGGQPARRAVPWPPGRPFAHAEPRVIQECRKNRAGPAVRQRKHPQQVAAAVPVAHHGRHVHIHPQSRVDVPPRPVAVPH